MTNTRELVANLLEVAECYSDGRETYEPFEQILREARSYLNNEKSVMAKNYPITPPPELVSEWVGEYLKSGELGTSPVFIATRAAQWGSDQELEACANWAEDAFMDGWGEHLRAARRPKPPSLKQQAIAELEQIPIDPEAGVLTSSLEIIRRALEALPE